MIHVRRMTRDFSFICFGIEYNRCASCFLTLSMFFFSPIRGRRIANGLGPRMVMWPLGRSSRTGLWWFVDCFIFFFSRLFSTSPIFTTGHYCTNGTFRSDTRQELPVPTQICGSMVFVWEIQLSGGELLPVTAWFKPVTNNHWVADRCSGF